MSLMLLPCMPGVAKGISTHVCRGSIASLWPCCFHLCTYVTSNYLPFPAALRCIPAESVCGCTIMLSGWNERTSPATSAVQHSHGGTLINNEAPSAVAIHILEFMSTAFMKDQLPLMHSMLCLWMPIGWIGSTIWKYGQKPTQVYPIIATGAQQTRVASTKAMQQWPVHLCPLHAPCWMSICSLLLELCKLVQMANPYPAAAAYPTLVHYFMH